MTYSENFLNELRNTVKEMLLCGDISEIYKVKELLEYSNIDFGNFITPMLKDDCSVSENSDNNIPNEKVAIDVETFDNQFTAYSPLTGKVRAISNKVATVTPKSRHGHHSEDGTYTEVPLEGYPQAGYLEPKEEETHKPKYMPYFHNPTSEGKLEGVVIYKLRAFIIEDLVTGEMLYKHTHYIARLLNLQHGDVISFNIGEDYKLLDISHEDRYDFKDGIQIARNCPVLKDEEGFYVPTDMYGSSLTDYGSPVSPYNIPYNVVDSYGIQEDDSVDLYIQPNSIPYVLYVNRGYYTSSTTSTSNKSIKEEVKSTKSPTKTKSRTYQKYDFDLKGKSIGFIGVPSSQKARVESLCDEKGCKYYELLDSTSRMVVESVPQRFSNLDILVVVKRFVSHNTIYSLKNVSQGSDVVIVNTSSHSVDAIERALYRGANGFPSEEGSSVVNYPLLNK